jgi:hypothetical protein
MNGGAADPISATIGWRKTNTTNSEPTQMTLVTMCTIRKTSQAGRGKQFNREDWRHHPPERPT